VNWPSELPLGRGALVGKLGGDPGLKVMRGIEKIEDG
jgi:hypothetical protein